jgi:hypothetical protein
MKTGGASFKHGINVVGFLISKQTFDLFFNFKIFLNLQLSLETFFLDF